MKIWNYIENIVLKKNYLDSNFTNDLVIVETSDHTRLSLKLSYTWQFDVNKNDPDNSIAVFDFVDDACKTIASRIRETVTQHSFNNFHKHFAKIIRESVFGVDENGKIKGRYEFLSNRLAITNVVIQSVEVWKKELPSSVEKLLNKSYWNLSKIRKWIL